MSFHIYIEHGAFTGYGPIVCFLGTFDSTSSLFLQELDLHFCSNLIKGIIARMNAGSQSAGVLILHSFPSNLLVSVTLFLLACQGTMSCLSLSLGLGLSICLVDRHPYQWLFFLQQSWRGFIWSHACLVAYTFNHTACERRFSSSENVVIHPLLIGSAVPAVGSLTEVLEFCMFDELGFSKADKWLVLGGGMSPGNSKVGFIYADSYTGDFYHHKCLCSIHEINVSMFSLIGHVLLACMCFSSISLEAMLAPTLCFG